MPGAELNLAGPRYEPMSGSVGDSTGTSPAPAPSPSVPPVDDPAMSHFDDSDSDSDLDDSDDPPFVPDPVDDSEPDVLGSPPLHLIRLLSHFLPDEPGPSASSQPHQSESPTPSDSQDSRDSPPSEPYKTHSRCSSRPVGEWCESKPSIPTSNRQTRCSGRTPESASEAAIAALEEANSVRTLTLSS